MTKVGIKKGTSLQYTANFIKGGLRMIQQTKRKLLHLGFHWNVTLLEGYFGLALTVSPFSPDSQSQVCDPLTHNKNAIQ